MNRLNWRLTMAIALAATALPCATAPAQTEDALKQGGERIVNFAVPGLGSSIFGSHAKVQPYQIDGKWVYALAIRNESGSRCTLNFDAKWNGERRFRVYFLGVPSELRATMQAQRKGDKKWGPDSNRGPQFKHRDLVVIDGGRNYLAERGFDAGQVLSHYQNACVVFLEEGLEFDRFLESLK
jgi:hypothetical protein